jgi:hypothetical protein
MQHLGIQSMHQAFKCQTWMMFLSLSDTFYHAEANIELVKPQISGLDVLNGTLSYQEHSSRLKAFKYQTWILCIKKSDASDYAEAKVEHVKPQMSDWDVSNTTLSFPKHASTIQM